MDYAKLMIEILDLAKLVFDAATSKKALGPDEFDDAVKVINSERDRAIEITFERLRKMLQP